MKLFSHQPSDKWRVTSDKYSRHSSLITHHSRRAFTLIEIALCLAIIGFALLAVMLVLPYGLGAQRDNREETIIGQDANVLLETIRSGSRGADDLTNYVYAITNYWTWTQFNPPQTISGVNGYTFHAHFVSPSPPNFPYFPGAPITNGANIIGLLGTPEFTDNSGNPIRKLDPAFVNSGYSNHIVAYVRSISGIGAEKPPQQNQIMREDTFTYRVYAVNAAPDFDVPEIWQARSYKFGDTVSFNYQGTATYWKATATTAAADKPSLSANWVQFTYYNHVAAGSQRELRLTFRWPQLPNGDLGKNGRQVFRSSMAQVAGSRNYSSVGQLLYFYSPQTFSPTP